MDLQISLHRLDLFRCCRRINLGNGRCSGSSLQWKTSTNAPWIFDDVVKLHHHTEEIEGDIVDVTRHRNGVAEFIDARVFIMGAIKSESPANGETRLNRT